MQEGHVVVEKASAFRPKIESEVVLRLRRALLTIRDRARFIESSSSLSFMEGPYFCYIAAIIFAEAVEDDILKIVTKVSQGIMEDFSLDGFSIKIERC